jgi:hypothetical protein
LKFSVFSFQLFSQDGDAELKTTEWANLSAKAATRDESPGTITATVE